MQKDRLSSDPDRPAARPRGRAASSAQELTKEELATRLNGVAAEDISDSPFPGIYQVAVGAQRRLRDQGRPLHHPRRHLRRRDERQRQRGDARARSRRDARQRRSREHDRVQACERRGQAQDHDLHGHRLRLLPAVPSRNRQGHGARHRGPLSVLSAHGPEHRVVDEGRSSLVRAEPQLRSDARQARRRDSRRLPRATRPSRRTTSSASDIGVRGTPAVFSETGELIGGYLPPATLAKVLDDPNAMIEE